MKENNKKGKKWKKQYSIESLNRQYRKYIKTRSFYPTDMALMKCLYLVTKNITKKWTQPYRNWGPIISELSIIFDGRIQFFENYKIYGIK